MKQFSFFLFACMLLLACTEKKQYTPYPSVSKKDSVKVDKKVDTLNVERQQQPEAPSKPAVTKKSAPASTVVSIPSSEPHDNMRGFDPPSEDDMDDNGMSRFMENNDEDGWY